jgi:hypothetical protein
MSLLEYNFREEILAQKSARRQSACACCPKIVANPLRPVKVSGEIFLKKFRLPAQSQIAIT